MKKMLLLCKGARQIRHLVKLAVLCALCVPACGRQYYFVTSVVSVFFSSALRESVFWQTINHREHGGAAHKGHRGNNRFVVRPCVIFFPCFTSLLLYSYISSN